MIPPLAASGFQNALLFATFAPSQRYLASDESPIRVRSHLGQSFLVRVCRTTWSVCFYCLFDFVVHTYMHANIVESVLSRRIGVLSCF
jgi:hypothetical protein